MDTGGSIDLSSLRSLSGRVRFDVNGDGTLNFGDIALTATTVFNIQHPQADVNIGGSLYLAAPSQLTMTSGSSLDVAGDFIFTFTAESQLQTDQAMLHANGSGRPVSRSRRRRPGTDRQHGGQFRLRHGC